MLLVRKAAKRVRIMGCKKALRIGVFLAAIGLAGCSAGTTNRRRAAPSEPAVSAEGQATNLRCQAGENQACAALGRMYLRGLGATRSLDAAETTLQRPCEAGIADACADLGEVYIERREKTDALPKAARLFQIACDRGSAKGCARLGRSLLFGVGVDTNQARAIELLDTVCKRGEPEACVSLGGFYMGAGGARRDYATALRLFEQAVANGGGHGTLAVMYWNGYGVERDLEHARMLLEVGCQQGDALACLNLGIMCQLGEGGEPDHDAALAHFQRACELGAERGCIAEDAE